MMLCNHTSRYHVAMNAIRGGALHNQRMAVNAHELESYFKHMAQKDKDFILQNGKGMYGKRLLCTMSLTWFV